nr:transposase [Pedobacter polysacchareus]
MDIGISQTTLSDITDKIIPEVKELQSRPLWWALKPVNKADTLEQAELRVDDLEARLNGVRNMKR